MPLPIRKCPFAGGSEFWPSSRTPALPAPSPRSSFTLELDAEEAGLGRLLDHLLRLRAAWGPWPERSVDMLLLLIGGAVPMRWASALP
ncbi:hypothetical protein [Streptomyces sp. NPDC004435]|uniref:hypothetical protein n=1 Tax=Streptomyces sp. NPDC004435 TaxID=3364701 RepID=UPI0036C48726